MKKVVILAPYFLPRRRVGAWRPYKFAIHLRQFGWDPHIVTIHEPNASLTQREAELLADISIFEIKSPLDLTHKIGHQLEFNGKFARSKASSNSDSKSFFSAILTWADERIPIDTWLLLFMLRKKKIEAYVEKVDPQVLWSTGDPWSSHWLAAKLTEKYQLPWVADFRDPWALGEFQLKNNSHLARQINRRQEEKCIQKATVLTFTSHKTEKLYRSEYEREISASETIFNSFDSTLFKGSHSQKKYFDDHYLNLIFFGRFRPLSPARPLIDLLDHICSRNPKIGQKIRIYSFGALTEEEKQNARDKNVYDNFIMLKPIALELALPILSQADILWLSTHQHMRNIIPAKLWDYLAAKRPILSIVPNPEVKNILQQTGSGLQLDVSDSTRIIDLLIRSVEAKMQGFKLPIPTSFDHNCIQQYDAPAATQKLAGIFDRIT